MPLPRSRAAVAGLALLLAQILPGCGPGGGEGDDDGTDDDASDDDGSPPDADADGHDESVDCDDTDPGIHPDAAEVCDGVDQDCDGAVDEDAVDAATWFPDLDGDGHGDADSPIAACAPPEGALADGSDCDDLDPSVHPAAAETCDDVDQDCDGEVDEDATDPPTWFLDEDGDGFGDAASGIAVCVAPPDRILTGGDCDDEDSGVHPGAVEVCDGVDQDCDGGVDEGLDLDGDGYTTCGGDCDDGNADVRPGAVESCDGADEDCDGLVDELAAGSPTWYRDYDEDGFGYWGVAVEACGRPEGYVGNSFDCDDTDAAVHPGAFERCANGRDDDCDGDVDESADGDGDGVGACADCDDADPGIHPGADEVCDGVDQDCDGFVDEAVSGAPTWYRDPDGDGFGDADVPLIACEPPEGYAAASGDCDETRADVHPGAEDACGDALDADCDGVDPECEEPPEGS